MGAGSPSSSHSLVPSFSLPLALPPSQLSSGPQGTIPVPLYSHAVVLPSSSPVELCSLTYVCVRVCVCVCVCVCVFVKYSRGMWHFTTMS